MIIVLAIFWVICGLVSWAKEMIRAGEYKLMDFLFGLPLCVSLGPISFFIAWIFDRYEL